MVISKKIEINTKVSGSKSFIQCLLIRTAFPSPYFDIASVSSCASSFVLKDLNSFISSNNNLKNH